MKKFLVSISFTMLIIFLTSCSSSVGPAENSGNDLSILSYSNSQYSFFIKDSTSYLEYIAAGRYPIWLKSKSRIGYISESGYEFIIFDFKTKNVVKNYSLENYGKVAFVRYSPILEKYLFVTYVNSLPSIAVMDTSGLINTISQSYAIANPATSGSDDWIYYLNRKNGVYNIYRMKYDGSSDMPITNSEVFTYGNFSVSYDGKYIVAPKQNLDIGYHAISIINLTSNEERLIDLSSLNILGYTSFSKDNKYIYFIGGYNREIYQINFDGSHLKKIISFPDGLNRPLQW